MTAFVWATRRIGCLLCKVRPPGIRGRPIQALRGPGYVRAPFSTCALPNTVRFIHMHMSRLQAAISIRAMGNLVEARSSASRTHQRATCASSSSRRVPTSVVCIVCDVMLFAECFRSDALFPAMSVIIQFGRMVPGYAKPEPLPPPQKNSQTTNF